MDNERRKGTVERRTSSESLETRMSLLEVKYEQITDNIEKAMRTQKEHLAMMQKLSSTQREIAETLKTRISVLESLKENVFMLCKYTLILIGFFSAISLDKLQALSGILKEVFR